MGGGLAGSEAAWQAARRGASVVLYEMRPHKRGPAHHTGMLAELVCSNSLRGAALENAVGLLKEELARLDSLIVTSAREAAVPAGGALAMDRERFGALVGWRPPRCRGTSWPTRSTIWSAGGCTTTTPPRPSSRSTPSTPA